jgi:glycosyltransferase involved in cell wall biosynthesis
VIRHVTVIVPAADEEDRIAACIQSLGVATHRLAEAGNDVTVEVVVVLDGCQDRTADIVAGFSDVRPVVSTARCVGAARATGTAAGVASPLALAHPLDDVWTAHTDADSQVPVDWLQHMVRSADVGADLVLGTVTPSLELPLPTRRAWQRFHLLADGHPHVHGANLGVRASTLRRLGGWRELRTGEDGDLVSRAVAAGARIHRTGAIPVRTSARRDGRAPEGFSSYLRALSAEDVPV